MIVIIVDGDIVAFQASAATDGRCYTVSNGEQFKYKKDATLRCAEIDGTMELSYKPEPPENAIFLVKKKLQSIKAGLEKLGYSGEMEIYLSTGGSFREKLHSPYKANRSAMRRPANLKACKDYLRKQGAHCRPGEWEADDLMVMQAVEAESLGMTPIIATIDKDLRQYPCHHYNFDKKTLDIVSEDEGRRNFYQQLLTGDATDGIIGLKGIGPKTAQKILKPCHDEFSMYVACLGEWMKRTPQEEGEEPEVFLGRLLHTVRLTGRLLYLAREEGDIWEPPKEM